MKVYIINAENELQIITVQADQDGVFQTLYHDKIIVDGESIPEAMQKFNELSIVFSHW